MNLFFPCQYKNSAPGSHSRGAVFIVPETVSGLHSFLSGSDHPWF
jgi:hypothetical protein